MKKILINGLLVCAVIVVIAFIPDAGNRLLSWLVPPRLYIAIGVLILLVLYKILIELRKNRSGDE